MSRRCVYVCVCLCVYLCVCMCQCVCMYVLRAKFAHVPLLMIREKKLGSKLIIHMKGVEAYITNPANGVCCVCVCVCVCV